MTLNDSNQGSKQTKMFISFGYARDVSIFKKQTKMFKCYQIKFITNCFNYMGTI